MVMVVEDKGEGFEMCKNQQLMLMDRILGLGRDIISKV